MKTERTMNQRLVRMLRDCMGSYAVMWKVIRHDPVERATAMRHLHEAIRLRELARRWAATD